MANLQQIKTDSNWGAEAPRINENFNAVNSELLKLGATSGIAVPLFASVSEAKKYITNPYVGKLILIGSTLPAPVYRWNGSSWVNTGTTGGNASAPLTDYYTKQEINAQQAENDSKFSELENNISDIFLTGKRGENLFNKNSLGNVYDAYLTSNGEIKHLADPNNWFVSHKISVKPNTRYSCTYTSPAGSILLLVFDSSDEVIQNINSTKYDLTTLQNASYVRFTASGNDIDKISFQEGDTSTEYEPFIYDYVTKKEFEELKTVVENNNVILDEKIELSTQFQSIGLEENSNYLFTVRNKYIGSNGVIQSIGSGYVCTDFIPLFGQTFEVSNARLFSTLYTVAFYKDKIGTAENFLGGDGKVNTSSFSRTYRKEDYTFEGEVAKYVVIMSQCGEDYIPTTANIKFPPYLSIVEALLTLDQKNKETYSLVNTINEKAVNAENMAKETNYRWSERETNSDIYKNGGYLNNNGTISNQQGYFHSDFIELNLRCFKFKGQIYTAWRSIAFYKEAELNESNYLGKYKSETTGSIDDIITPNDYTFDGVIAKYVVFSDGEQRVNTNEITFSERISQQVGLLETRTDLDNYIESNDPEVRLSNLWKGKNISLYGDSITEISNNMSVNSWGSILANIMKCSIIPRGWGATAYKTQKTEEPGYVNEDGSRSSEVTQYPIYDRAFCSWERITKMYPPMIKDSIDAVIIMGGTNELIQDIQKGDTVFIKDTEQEPLDTAWKNSPYYKDWNGDFDTSKLSGAICSTILKFQLWMPNAVIIIASMIGGGSYENSINSLPYRTNGVILPQTPTSGLTQWDINKIMMEVSSYMNTPFIDVWRNSGISIFNRRWFIRDGVHPYDITDEAGKVHRDGNNALAKAMVGGLYGISPRYSWFEFADKSYNITIHVTDERGNVEGANVTLVSGKEIFTFNGMTNTEGNYVVAAWGRIVYKVLVTHADKSYNGYINVADDETFEIII